MLLIDRIRKFNIFENPEATSEEDLKNQRISTFIFLLLFILSLFILLTYTSLTSVTKTVIVQNPSLSVYNSLQTRYPDTLVCPCRSVTNAYNKFILDFQPIYNQICSSDFISDEWINYVNYRSKPDLQYHYTFDFRHSAFGFFNMIKILCQSSSSKISEQLIVFYTNLLVTENVMSKETFNTTIYASQYNFISTTTKSFSLSLNAFRSIMHGYGIVNRLETNFRLFGVEIDGTWSDVTLPIDYKSEDCICPYDTLCKKTTGIYVRQHPDHVGFKQNAFNNTLLHTVPGVNVGCQLLDTVLQSDLSCLYNSSCLSQLYQYLTDSSYQLIANVTPLHVPTSYASLPLISELVEHLLVDDWLFSFSYKLYFSECNPSVCSYIYNEKFDIVYTITTILGCLGGIVTILMIITLPAVTFLRNRFKSSTMNTSELQTERLGLSTKFKNLVLNLNLFEDPEERNEWHLYNQRISTRVFTISMIITLAIFVLFTSISFVTRSVVIKQPTVDIYLKLQAQYPETLTCPCSSISIEYKQFISFQPTFHQICSSDFVTINWIRSFAPNEVLSANDLRDIGPIYFTTLSEFCNLSLETINNALFSFNSTKYVTRNVQQLDLFQSQTEQIIGDLEKSTTNSFLQLLSLYKHTFIDNALFSGYLSSYRYTTVTDNSSNSLNQVFSPIIFRPDINDNSTRCSCKTSPLTCSQSTGIYKTSGNSIAVIFIVPGVRIGCFLTESLFQSTLECFFDQQCLDKVQNFTVSTSRFPFTTTALKYNSTNTQYNTNTRIEDIVENLMIEQWNNKTSFMSYFEQCNAQSCTYSYRKQGDLDYILTTIIGLIGGLITVLRILIPPIVSYARRNKKPLTSSINRPQQVSHTRIQQMLISLKTIILTLNFFKNINKRSDNQLYRQCIATRIYFILSSLSFTIFLLFISLENSTHTIIIEHPTIDQYNALLRQYSDSLYCSCTTISVEYQDFISFQPRLHTICSSVFINPTSVWLSIDYPTSMFAEFDHPTFRTKLDDFRNMASPFFQSINSSCQLSLQTISTQLLAFYSTTFITPKLISLEQFQLRVNQLVSGFIGNTAQVFLSSLLLVNNMTRANMLLSALSSDSILTLYPDYYYRIDYDYEYVYNNIDQVYNSTLSGTKCDCQYSSWCKQQAIVYDIDAITYLFVIPGIFVGCYVVETVLQSDLQCFYSFDCLQELSDKLKINISESDVLSLNSSRYQTDTSMLEIISSLMVEEWNNRTSYSIYFNRCQPKSCTATYINRGNIVYIVTRMITLIGGLTKLYRFLVPVIVSVFMKIIIPFIRQKFNQNNINPTIETIPPTRIPI